MKESKMYQRMKIIFNGFPIRLYRIENRTGRVPDIYYSFRKSNGFIELKNIDYYACKDKIKIPFRPGQYPWIKEQLKYNEYIFLIGTFKHSDSKVWIFFKGKDIKEEYSKKSLLYFTEKEIHTCLVHGIH
jgi:hypothetical protein